jgi:hypothetical protein
MVVRKRLGRCGALFALAAWVSPAAADTIIRVDWDVAQLEAAPHAGVFQTQHHWRAFTLSGRNQLSVGTSSGTQHVLLGTEGAQMWKGNANWWTYRVVGNTLFYVNEFDSWTELTKITSTERGYDCTVAIRLKPGHKYFEWSSDGETRYFSTMRADNVTCEIKNQ